MLKNTKSKYGRLNHATPQHEDIGYGRFRCLNSNATVSDFATFSRHSHCFHPSHMRDLIAFAGRLTMIGRLKSWVTWSWTYLWALWFLLVVALIYILRGPLKITESLESGTRVLSVPGCSVLRRLIERLREGQLYPVTLSGFLVHAGTYIFPPFQRRFTSTI